MKQTTIRILRLPVEGPAAVATIDNNLNAMQAEVGGLIEPISLNREGIDAFLNEEALLEELPLNPHMTALYRRINGDPRGIGNAGLGYHGNAFVSRLDRDTGDQEDLTEEDIFWLLRVLDQGRN